MIMSQMLQEWLTGFLLFLPKLIAALFLSVGSLVVASLLGRLVRRGLARHRVDPELTLLLSQITRWGLIILGVVVALQQIDFRVTAFLASLGILGFTIGFALQDVSKNFVAGILLLLEQPFDIGDVIQVGDFLGTVVTVRLRATELHSLDGQSILIPNGEVFTSTIVNYNRTHRRRVSLAVGVAYDSDLELVHRTATEAISAIPGVLPDPAPKIILDNLGPSSIDLTAYYWIDLDKLDAPTAKGAGIKAIKTAFEQAGIEIPYPTQTIYVRQGDSRENNHDSARAKSRHIAETSRRQKESRHTND
ncbi:MAG TPA: mechanosensitive ion channel [Anaerolineae bacterium]|nr:mechanosensitive ion channel [Anaerolineae bacterium]